MPSMGHKPSNIEVDLGGFNGSLACFDLGVHTAEVDGSSPFALASAALDQSGVGQDLKMKLRRENTLGLTAWWAPLARTVIDSPIELVCTTDFMFCLLLVPAG